TDLSLKHIRRHRGRVFSSAATVWDREFTGTLGKVVALLTVLLTVSSDVCRKFPRAQVSGARLRRVRDSDDYRHDDIRPGGASIGEERLLRVSKMRMHPWCASRRSAQAGRLSVLGAKYFNLKMEREAAIRLLRALVAVGLRQRESMANAT